MVPLRVHRLLPWHSLVAPGVSVLKSEVPRGAAAWALGTSGLVELGMEQL